MEKYIENDSINIYKDSIQNYEKENNIKNIFDGFLWKEILSKHPKFKDVFEDKIIIY